MKRYSYIQVAVVEGSVGLHSPCSVVYMSNEQQLVIPLSMGQMCVCVCVCVCVRVSDEKCESSGKSTNLLLSLDVNSHKSHTAMFVGSSSYRNGGSYQCRLSTSCNPTTINIMTVTHDTFWEPLLTCSHKMLTSMITR